jgi:hypothetical protein
MLQDLLEPVFTLFRLVTAIWRFALACFVVPLGDSTLQSDRLDAFYRKQAQGRLVSL